MHPTDPLYTAIQSCLLHVTSRAGYIGIAADGWIKPNDGTRPYTFRNLGVCHVLHAVALLDLALDKWPLFGPNALAIWVSLLTRHPPVTFVLDIDRQALSPDVKLLGFSELASWTEPPFGRQMLPDTEVCYPGSIPISAIRRTILIDAWDIHRYAIFDGFPVSEREMGGFAARGHGAR